MVNIKRDDRAHGWVDLNKLASKQKLDPYQRLMWLCATVALMGLGFGCLGAYMEVPQTDSSWMLLYLFLLFLALGALAYWRAYRKE